MSTHLLNEKGIDDSTENLSGITNGHQNYEKCESSDWWRRKKPEVKSKAEDF